MFERFTCRRIGLACSLLVVGAMVAAGDANGAVQTPVITGPSDQYAIAAESAGNALAWSRNNAANTSLFHNLYVRVGSGPAIRINSPGTWAKPGGFSGDRLIFDQNAGGHSDLRFYNVVRHTFGAAPGAWNTGNTNSPTISGRYVLFSTFDSVTQQTRILLGDLTTKRVKVLLTVTGAGKSAEPGQVNGNWAAWTYCREKFEACDVYQYNIANDRTTKVSNTFATGVRQDNPSIAANGTIYFFHYESNVCGDPGVTLNRRVLGQSRTVLATIPVGYDVFKSYVDDSTGTPFVYFPRYQYVQTFPGDCDAQQADIYRMAG